MNKCIFFFILCPVAVLAQTVLHIKERQYNVSEDGGSIEPVLVLTSSLSIVITVQVFTMDVQGLPAAVGNQDYVSLSTTVQFDVGVTSVSVAVSILDDNMLEDDEPFMVRINASSLPSNITVDSRYETMVTVLDDDPLLITNGPMDTTMCTGSIAIISCGYVHVDPNSVIPSWRIVMRNDDGSVMSNTSVSSADIIGNTNDGLEWLPDRSSGMFMSPNSRLLVGPVDESDNQSSYQCSVTHLFSGTVRSSIGTLIVAAIPPVENLMVVDQCTTIRASWDITEGSCTHLSYNVTLSSSDGTTLQGPFTTNDTVFIFNDTETFNGILTVSVVPINGNVRGASVTETAVFDISPNDLPTVTSISVSEICVTSLNNVSWEAPNFTCGDICYNVSVYQPSIEGNLAVDRISCVTGLDCSNVPGSNCSDVPEVNCSIVAGLPSCNVTDLSNKLRNVTITVTAIDRVGERNDSVFFEWLRESENVTFICQESQDNCNLIPDSFETDDVIDMTDCDEARISWKRPMLDPCRTLLSIASYRINITVESMDGSINHYTSNPVNDTVGGMTGIFDLTYCQIFNEPLEPNAMYNLTVVIPSTDLSIEPSPEPVLSDDEISGISAACFVMGSAWICCMVALYCYVMKMEESPSDKEDEGCGFCVLIILSCGIVILIRNCCPRSKCIKIFFLISSLGLGYVVWTIYSRCCLENSRVSSEAVQMDKDKQVHLDKPSDVYDSPGLKKDTITDKAENQALYSYAQTGPVNVVIPGSANS